MKGHPFQYQTTLLFHVCTELLLITLLSPLYLVNWARFFLYKFRWGKIFDQWSTVYVKWLIKFPCFFHQILQVKNLILSFSTHSKPCCLDSHLWLHFLLDNIYHDTQECLAHVRWMMVVHAYYNNMRLTYIKDLLVIKRRQPPQT